MLGFHKYKTSANLGLHPCLAKHNRPLHKPTILKMYDWKERGIGHLEILLKVWSQTTVQTGLLAAEEDGCMTFLTLSKTTKAALKKKTKTKITSQIATIVSQSMKQRNYPHQIPCLHIDLLGWKLIKRSIFDLQKKGEKRD